MARGDLRSAYDKQTDEWIADVAWGIEHSGIGTKEKLAKRMHTPYSTVCRQLKDIDNMKLRDIRELARIIGLEVVIRRKGESKG